MRNFKSFKLKLAVASVLVLVATKYAKADLPVDDRFDPAAGGSVTLRGIPAGLVGTGTGSGSVDRQNPDSGALAPFEKMRSF